MKAAEIYRSLMNCSHWASKSRAMVWLAARYYAGVDSLDQLRATTRPHIAAERYGHVVTVGAVLSSAEVDEIIRLR